MNSGQLGIKNTCLKSQSDLFFIYPPLFCSDLTTLYLTTTWHNVSSWISAKRFHLSLLYNITDDEVISELIQVKDIGRWTAEMFLIFCLGRQDIMPWRFRSEKSHTETV